MQKEIENLIKEVEECAKEVYEELGSGWDEKIYQKAMEIALRERGIDYEEQRVLPVSFKGHIVGEGYPDLIVWLRKNKKRIGVVIDLKSTSEIQEDHRAQVAKYIQELKKQLKENEEVYPVGFIFDFTKPPSKKIKDGIDDRGGLKILRVEVKVNPKEPNRESKN
jgi:GxxExxY protein